MTHPFPTTGVWTTESQETVTCTETVRVHREPRNCNMYRDCTSSPRAKRLEHVQRLYEFTESQETVTCTETVRVQHSIDISSILLSVSITPWIYESQLSATGRVVYLFIALQVIRRCLDLWLGRKCWTRTFLCFFIGFFNPTNLSFFNPTKRHPPRLISDPRAPDSAVLETFRICLCLFWLSFLTF